MQNAVSLPPISQETKLLKATMKELELKITALESLVDVTEQELKINSRKKSGTKQ